MKLFLSSYRFSNQPQALVQLAGKGKKVAAIMNARDFQTNEHRSLRCQEELDKLHELGFKAEEFDLRDYFERKQQLETNLQKYDMVWVSGGNVFLLRTAMRLSGFDEILKPLLDSDAFVYAGYSAGGCVLSPSLQGYEIVDDQSLVQEIYNLPTNFDGLGIIDYHFEPHYQSDHPESAAVDKEVAYLKANNIPYRTLHDGEAIIVDGNSERLLS